jgi:hypothetical protein
LLRAGTLVIANLLNDAIRQGLSGWIAEARSASRLAKEFRYAKLYKWAGGNEVRP